MIKPSRSLKLDNAPLVSVIIINWNYGEFIERTILSVKKQNYKNFEVLVVNNGSADDSAQIITKAIADDPRFKAIHLNKNLGQLGAFFACYKDLNGKYIINLDADDLLFPNFITKHVQTHLGLGEKIGLTSSDVTVIGKHDEVLRHGYRSRSIETPEQKGLLPINNSLDLNLLSEEDYQLLSDSVSTYRSKVGWIWGLGTSNMYSRSVLDNIYEDTKKREWMRSADSYLNPLVHALAGSSLINQELSAYRVHGANYYGSLRIAGGGRKDREDRQQQLKYFFETAGSILTRAEHYAPLLGDKYWDAFSSVSKFIALPSGKIMPGLPETLSLIETSYDHLCEVLTKEEVLRHLPDYFMLGDLYTATSKLKDPITPSNLRLN